MPDSLWPHGLQHARLPCPPLSPKVFSNSCLLNCDAISSSHPLPLPSPLPSVFPSIRVFFIRVSSLEIMWRASVVAQSLLTLQPHGLQHTRLLCSPQSPGLCSDLCLLSQWWLSNYLISLPLCFPFAFNLSQWQIYPMVNSFPTF